MRKAIAAVAGALSLLAGLLYTAAVSTSLLRGKISIGTVGLASLSAYFLLMGIRGFRYVSGIKPSPGFGWGRILVGCWMILTEIDIHLHPAANYFKADNDAQALGMEFAAVMIVGGGAWLLWAGIRAGLSARASRSAENASAASAS